MGPADLVAVVHAVRELDAAARFCREALGLPERERGEGFAVFDSGAVALRLVAAAHDGATILELATSGLEEAAAALLSHPGVAAGGPTRRAGAREERGLRAPHGLSLVLARQLSEDELPEPPPLPASLPWRAEATSLLQALLRLVPAELRDLARRKATEASEVVAVEAGEVEVAVAHAVRGLLRATPAFQQPRLLEELARRGLAPEDGSWA